MLDDVLKYMPQEWCNVLYSNRNFVCVPLNRNGAEYKCIKTEFECRFRGTVVINIKRVQHPFAYASYKIRQEQLTAKYGRSPLNSIEYWRVTDYSKINNLLKHNVDYRQPGIVKMNGHFGSHGFVISVRKLVGPFSERDSNRYPEHIIQYEFLPNYDGDVRQLNDMLLNISF